MAKELVFKEHGFEYEVRNELGIFDGPITDDDVLSITSLSLCNFDFIGEDLETLSLFKNLEYLAIDTFDDTLDFLKSLTNLKNLDIVYFPHRNRFDFSKVEHLKKLEVLRVSGGDVSDIDFINVDALTSLPNLKELHFHEFGGVDLSPLRQMNQLEFFFCGFADEVRNIDALKYLTNLKHLELIDIEVDNLDFLDNFPNNIEIELCLNVCGNADFTKLKRFTNSDIYEMRLNGKYI